MDQADDADGQVAQGGHNLGAVTGVKPRVLWRLVYLVPVVAGCDCSWRWVSGAQAASCSAGVRIRWRSVAGWC